MNNVNFASMRLETADLAHKDKYGFQQDDVTTFDAFQLENVRFREPLLDNQFQCANLQNNRLWIFTAKNKVIVKQELTPKGDGAAKGNPRIVEDQNHLRRLGMKFRKMFVDATGNHCFMVADHEVFYNHWESDNIFKVPLFDQMGAQQRVLKSIDVSKAMGDDAAEAVLDVLIGTEDGHILHGAVEKKGTRAGNLEVVSPF